MTDFSTIFSNSVSETLTIKSTLIIVFSSLILGLLISLAYMLTHKQAGYSQSFTVTLIMLPAIISIIILLVGSNVARAFSLAGAFSIIRFRSAPGDPRDIAYIFFTLAVGLACGMGFIAYAVLFAVVLCLAMLILHMTNYAGSKTLPMSLKITIPENLNYQGLFDDILSTSTKSWKLIKVKTSDFGTLFELFYSIDLLTTVDQKSMLDAIRCRNSNLNISLTLEETKNNFQF